MKKPGLRHALSRWPIFAAILLLAVLPARTYADEDDDDHDGDSRPAVRPPEGQRIRPQAPERELKDMMRQVDNRRIQATIQKLVSFGTRHTESSMTDPNRGIGAAINYVFTTLQGYAATSNGRMTVALQTYHQAPIAGTIVTNAIDDAPGADDDASGVAVMMEAARVMATHAPESTIVFTAVDGEEQ